ncbi:RSP_2648 family PIN domain-containing protein [Roseobacter sinensis]|uniref:PIN domain-containing protein n=1 Tax=Roseobacter sinensis TaxID=2931391 RepID=A0ABT3BBS5_9RHOB|nr:PIN domain-containing protein [Roseobacter sp. WL0113]MCV3271023.1 PIN domain-containing protein [Roseobacter sp. WL0113]
MKITLDACVLYPTVMREMLLGVAATGAFEPVWSARILEEWGRAAQKLGPAGEAQARAEIALVRAKWPRAGAAAAPHLEARLWLPDAHDIHVLATAISTSSVGIMTLNAKDFPRGILFEEGLIRLTPDEHLYRLWRADPGVVAEVANTVRDEAERLSGQPWAMRALLKKARLPRLAKALTG